MPDEMTPNSEAHLGLPPNSEDVKAPEMWIGGTAKTRGVNSSLWRASCGKKRKRRSVSFSVSRGKVCQLPGFGVLAAVSVEACFWVWSSPSPSSSSSFFCLLDVTLL